MVIQYKVQKVKVDGVFKFLPMRRKSILGFGKWIVDPDWAGIVKNSAEEAYLGMETDSTLSQCRAFVAARDGSIDRNKFYND